VRFHYPAIVLATLTIPSCQHSFSKQPAAVAIADLGAAAEAPVVSVAQPVFAVEPSTHPTATKDLLERGKKVFARQCAPCHGPTGLSDGPAAYLLYPKPRNFKKGPFRFVTTWEGTPTDDDLYRVISRGIPGSAMPSWAHLEEGDRWGWFTSPRRSPKPRCRSHRPNRSTPRPEILARESSKFPPSRPTTQPV